MRRYPNVLAGREYANTDHVTYMRILPQPPMQGRERLEVSSRVSKRIVTHMRQRHISHAQRVQLSQDRDRIPDLVSSVRPLDLDRGHQDHTHPSTPRRLAILPFSITSPIS